MDWQPIATAPKDGTEIDGWLDSAVEESHRVTDISWNNRKGCWSVWDNSDGSYLVSIEGGGTVVTHWMPKPPKPSD